MSKFCVRMQNTFMHIDFPSSLFWFFIFVFFYLWSPLPHFFLSSLSTKFMVHPHCYGIVSGRSKHPFVHDHPTLCELSTLWAGTLGYLQLPSTTCNPVPHVSLWEHTCTCPRLRTSWGGIDRMRLLDNRGCNSNTD